MRLLLESAKQWLLSLWKTGDRLYDVFRPRGYVEARLYYANGPRKGELAAVHQGRNVVTSWLSGGGAAPTSGRDMMRRILVPAAFSGSLAADADATVNFARLGSGTTAETASDTALGNEISGSEKALADVDFDLVSPFVTFIFEYNETEVNQAISEAGLFSGSTRYDFLARKTFTTFTKTSDFTLQIRWTIRF